MTVIGWDGAAQLGENNTRHARHDDIDGDNDDDNRLIHLSSFMSIMVLS